MKILVVLLIVVATVCQADVTVEPASVTVLVGEDAIIPCKYESSSDNPPKYTWSEKSGSTWKRLYVLDKGNPDPSASFADPNAAPRDPPLEVADDGSLKIMATTLADSKRFKKLQCEVELGSDGQKQETMNLLVALLPEDDAKVGLSAYNQGKSGFDITTTPTLIGFCESSKSHPTAEITFYKGGAPVVVALEIDGVDISFMDDEIEKDTSDGVSHTLNKSLMKAVTISDHQAEFICNVKVKYGDMVFSRNYTMPKFNVNYPTQKAEFVRKPVAYLGETLTLKCIADGYPEPTISIDGIEGEMLDVTVTEDLDGKEYVCTAYNDNLQQLTPVQSKPYIMEVLSLSDPDMSGLDIREGKTQVKLGTKVDINCGAEGKPTPVVHWYKGDEMVSKTGTLSFASVGFGDAGDYECRASNGHDNLAKKSQLNIKVNGIELDGDDKVNVAGKAEEKVTLQCAVNAHPAPTFSWNIDNDKATPTISGFKYTSQLEVGPLSSDLSKKEYICTVSGYEGTKMEKTFVLPEIATGSSSTAIIIVILVLILVIAVVIAVLYNKGIICKKSEEKGDESAEADIEGGMHNDDDVEAGNGAATQPGNEEQPAVGNPEEEKLMTDDRD